MRGGQVISSNSKHNRVRRLVTGHSDAGNRSNVAGASAA
jgi:hypothetical protein